MGNNEKEQEQKTHSSIKKPQSDYFLITSETEVLWNLVIKYSAVVYWRKVGNKLTEFIIILIIKRHSLTKDILKIIWKFTNPRKLQ